jgi:hypothetical protein
MSLELEEYYKQMGYNEDPWESVECRTVDPEMWWRWQELRQTPAKEHLVEVELALTICNRCPLRLECLNLGLRGEDLYHGIWGGLFPGERIALLRTPSSGYERRQVLRARTLRKQLDVRLSN